MTIAVMSHMILKASSFEGNASLRVAESYNMKGIWHTLSRLGDAVEVQTYNCETLLLYCRMCEYRIFLDFLLRLLGWAPLGLFIAEGA